MAAGLQFRLRPRTIRVLSLTAVGLLVGGAALLMGDGHDGIARGFIYLGGAASALVMAGSIGARAPQPGELDEREQAERARAVMAGFVVTASLICALSIWLTLAGVVTSIALIQPSLFEIGMLLLGLFWLHMVMPSAVLAWRTPVDEED